ncbi:MAG: hypothetical protein LBJ44_01795 [Propionibacteriaceae bacterium]|jgi:regulator of RNase E activity RraA|nr:hypothetical protein [Propionibacteriaceae bacterium]
MSEEILSRLERVDTAVVYDVMAHMGLRDQCLSSDIAPLDPESSFVGRALTVQGSTAAPWGSPIGPALDYQLFHLVQPGSVIVIDTGGNNRSGPWGANTGRTALVAGARGVVIDGGTRDRRDLIAMGLPVFARFVTPVLSHDCYEVKSVGQTISLSGQTVERVEVRNGDYIHGDADGVVVVPQEIVETVMAAAEHAQAVEHEIQRRLTAGQTREEVDQACDRWTHLRKIGLFVEGWPSLRVPVVEERNR